ncbi:MAG: hypothetical protein J0M04_20180 [Verrucomicrobia bacterium]|nr:hypothetical protein [Verrucomicrobiota bacterium]
MRRDDMVGTEFDWVAADQADRIGIFTTAGYGSIPGGILEQRDHHARIIESIEDLAEIPGWADLLTYTGSVPVFVYDWTLHAGPYRRSQSSRGAGSLKLHDLPVQLHPFIVRLDLSFDTAETFDVPEIKNKGEQDVPPNA